ncbi:MAG TPA: D-alanyl-D-alanine carboxypeptidase, partial [Acidimicrobiales bacterium]|nr:D-alanyl-D-alanine carboxypeptidase [Acidimicrobiales bacterium]
MAPILLAVVAVTSASIALTSPLPTSQAAAGAAMRLQSPVLSARRVPALLARTMGTLRLDASLDTVLADPGLAGARQASCLAVAQGGAVVYSKGATAPLLPASNLKLLTATAALDRLGPTTRFVTNVMASRPAVRGKVTGNLYLIGGGDPLLRTADYAAAQPFRELTYTHLEDLAQQVKAAGVTHVTGAVVGDESRYDTQRYVPTWKPSYA